MTRRLSDWALLISLVIMWGTSFMFNELALTGFPPATVVAGRLLLGAVILAIYVAARGAVIPTSLRTWGGYLALALCGNCIPFYLITSGQQTIDSAVTGILIATMPLATLFIAHAVLPGERATAGRVAGYLLGFAGIVILMGPTAWAGIGVTSGQLLAQLAVLGAAMCYACNSVMARMLVKDDVPMAAAATLLISAVLMIPVALLAESPWPVQSGPLGLVAVIWLGVGPTAIATLCYFALIRSAGPTFMSLVNYLSPVVAIAAGLLVLDERVGAEAYAGLVLILAGMALGQRAALSPSAVQSDTK